MTFLCCLPLEVLSSNLTEPKPAQTCLIFETLVNKNKDWKSYCKNKWWNIVCSYFYLIRDLVILSCSDDLLNSVCCIYLMFSVDLVWLRTGGWSVRWFYYVIVTSNPWIPWNPWNTLDFARPVEKIPQTLENRLQLWPWKCQIPAFEFVENLILFGKKYVIFWNIFPLWKSL